MRDRYWRNYDFYGLLHGCGAAAPAAVYSALSRDACLQRCSSRWDCQAVAHHQEQALALVNARHRPESSLDHMILEVVRDPERRYALTVEMKARAVPVAAPHFEELGM